MAGLADPLSQGRIQTFHEGMLSMASIVHPPVGAASCAPCERASSDATAPCAPDSHYYQCVLGATSLGLRQMPGWDSARLGLSQVPRTVVPLSKV